MSQPAIGKKYSGFVSSKRLAIERVLKGFNPCDGKTQGKDHYDKLDEKDPQVSVFHGT